MSDRLVATIRLRVGALCCWLVRARVGETEGVIQMMFVVAAVIAGAMLFVYRLISDWIMSGYDDHYVPLVTYSRYKLTFFASRDIYLDLMDRGLEGEDLRDALLSAANDPYLDPDLVNDLIDFAESFETKFPEGAKQIVY